MIVLKKPIITEKSMALAQKGFFTFEVDRDATKPLVAKVVSEKFGVTVEAIKIINKKGVTKFQRVVRGSYRTSAIKKAIVQLKKGEKIALFETPREGEAVVTTAESEPSQIKEKKSLLRGTKVRV